MTNPDARVRILIVDDHMVVRAGLAQVLGEVVHFHVVAEAENGEEALARCRQHLPDVVVIDVMMPGVDGVAAIEAIRRQFPGMRAVALSAFGDRAMVDTLKAAGASAFLPKSVSARELVDVIDRVRLGESWFPESRPVLGESPPRPSTEVDSPELGRRQRQVLALLTKGYTNNEIAEYMGIAMPTARYHVSALLEKLGVSNRAEAAALAIRENLIGPSDF